MDSTLTNIGNCFLGNGKAYVYILFSKGEKALYVGQTADKGGVIGRLCSHISSSGTFRERLYERGIDLDYIQDLHVFSHRLPDEGRFIGYDRTLREGVEYLVQKNIHLMRTNFYPKPKIISNITYNDSASLAIVKDTAQQIVTSFEKLYNTS